MCQPRRPQVRRLTLGLMAAVVLLAGCSTPPRPPEDYAPDPDARQHWVLRHRLLDTKGMTVTEQYISGYEEHSTISLINSANGQTDDCFVIVAVPGAGGPENKVGEKIETAFDGRPAMRNGSGAEGDYLMWQLEDTSWVEVGCDEPKSIDRVAAAVDLESSSIRVPVDLDLPKGLRPSLITTDLHLPGARIYLSAPLGASPRWDLVIMVGAPGLSPSPTGEPTTIGGRPALIDDDKRNPVVWLREQDQWVYVGASSSDTGPYPDRSDEIPVLEDIASTLSFAKDLSDPGTWFSAENVFG